MMLLKEYPVKDNTQSVADYALTVAKAQLEQVVKWMSAHGYQCPDDGDSGLDKGDLLIYAKDWQALEEELG